MRSRSYKKISKEKKAKIVSMVIAGESIAEVSRTTKTAESSIKNWLANEEINPDREYALKYKEEHPWLGKMKSKGFKETDPSPEGVPEVTTSDPEELRRENKDLRKKIEYLEDKVLYLEKLYELIGTMPSDVSKKKDSKPSFS